MKRVLTAVSALAASLGLTACAPADEPQELDREAIEQIVRAYLVENPEVIEEALVELQRRARAREQQALTDAIAANATRMFEDPRDPAIGSADAPVTIVEFFDYRCSFCMVTNEWMQNTIANHGDQVRVVFKELPIRGAASVESSRAALAVWNTQPDAYLQFHSDLMSASGPLPGERIDEIAAAAGIDVATMREAMEDEAIVGHLDDVRALAQAIGITGTPFFIIGDEIIPGADTAGMQRALLDALEAAS